MSMEFYNRTTPKARKEYICEYCNNPIHVGDAHSYETGKYAGDMFSRRLHFPCFNIMQKYSIENGENEFTWDAIDEWIHDVYCHECEKCDECGYDDMRSCPNVIKDFDSKN